MVANLAYNPFGTTNAQNTFVTEFNGLVQGVAHPDPATRWALASGLLSQSETLPMWGGVGINELIPTPQASPPMTPSANLGGTVSRATKAPVTGGSATAGILTGFSTFDQMYGMVNSPQSPVQLAGSGMQVGIYRLGSGQRLAVAMAPSLVSLYGLNINQPVSWDFVNQQLVPYAPAYASATISGATWASTSGGQTTFTVNVDYTALLVAGDVITVSGVVNTGGTSTAAFNGQFIVVSVTDATHVVVTQVAAASPGTYASGGTIAAGGGALPCNILKVEAGNSMIVSYNPTTNTAIWNRQGSCALIQI